MEVSHLFLVPALLGLGVALALGLILTVFLVGVEALGAAERRRMARDYPEAEIREAMYPGDRG